MVKFRLLLFITDGDVKSTQSCGICVPVIGGVGAICNGFVICSFDSAACSSFFQSRYVQVNNGTSVRRPHYWTLSSIFYFFFLHFLTFTVQCPEFVQDAPIVCLGLNLS